MDSNSFAHHPAHRFPQQPLHQLTHSHPHQQHNQPQPQSASFYPSIDVDALAAGVQRFIPGRAPAAPGYSHNNSYIHLPPGVDPATVDFRTFYPYNPSEVKHRKRTTRSQLKVLEDMFKRETKPNAALRKQLAAQLEMTPRGVQVWFQNRRAKEKNLAKKASSSSANGKRPICQDAQKGVANTYNSNEDDALDGDVDPDDGDVAASVSTVAEDDIKSNCEHPAHPASLAPGTASSCALDERKRSHSSSNSSESTSPELTPPSGPNDIPPRVDVSPPIEDVKNGIQHEMKQSGLSFLPTAWQGPQRSMSRTPTSGMGTDHGLEYEGEMGYGTNTMDMAMQDQFSRRTSLPLIGPSRVRVGYHGSPRVNSTPLGGVNAARMSGFDPSVRRMSLDRLASHPYAHVAAQANHVVYGSNLSRYRPTLPATAHSTPTHTPQARPADLPPISQTHMDVSRSTSETGDGNGDISSNDNTSNNSGIPDLSLPQIHHHPSLSPPAPEVRPELMHRQSLPAHIAVSEQFPLSSGTTGLPPPPQSADPMSVRFPRQSQVYALSARNYQPPIPGPLPNPNFSFGSVGNGDVENPHRDGTDTPDVQLQSQLGNFQFPALDDGKDSNNGRAGSNNGLDMELDGDARPNLYYRDTQNLHGPVDPYASRFGSIASTVSVAESESSVTSGACFSSESASNFEIQQDMTNGYNNARRASCTGSMMDMFSNLDMRNGSHSSLPHPHESRKQQDAHHPQQQHPQQMPISRSSELALALLPEDDNKSSIYGGDNGSSVNVNMNDTNDAGMYGRASMSSSDLSHGHGSIHGYGQGQRHGNGYSLGHRHPLASSSRSAASSRSSLNVPSRLPRLDTDKLDFLHNYDAVSETGHYSPVSQSHPLSPAPFEYPLTDPGSSGSTHSFHGSTGGSRSGTLSGNVSMNGSVASLHDHQQPYSGVEVHQSRQGQYYNNMSVPYPKEGNYVQPQPSPGYSIHGHSQENVSAYGYYN